MYVRLGIAKKKLKGGGKPGNGGKPGKGGNGGKPESRLILMKNLESFR